MMLRKLAERPCSADRPWSLVIYSDEIVPGNALAFQHRRKLWAIYVSFLEFEEHLNNEYAWIPIVAVRTSQLKNVVSGISQVFAAVLKVFFGKLLTYDFRTGGAQLKAPDGSTFRFWATLAMFIQDGAAQKSVWGARAMQAHAAACFVPMSSPEAPRLPPQMLRNLLSAQLCMRKT